MKLMASIVLLLLAFPARAQEPHLQLAHLDRLAERAAESVEVTLGGSQLQFARKLARLDRIGHGDKLAKMDSILVRLFEFEQAGEYAESDVEAIRMQLRAPGWARFTAASGAEEDAFVMRRGNEILAYAALYADSRKLCVFHVTGRMDEGDIVDFNRRSDCRGWNESRRHRR
jgi:hypothetical protein